MSKKRGIMGGRFDPVHIAHIKTAQSVLAQFQLDEMRLIPTFNPPHREQAIAGFEHRCKMIALCIEPLPGFVLDKREKNHAGKSYTWETLISLSQEYPGDEFFIMMGSDAFLQFDTWYNWQKILDHATLIVDLRPGDQWQQLRQKKQHLLKQYHQADDDSIQFCDVPQIAISSSQVRQQLQQGFDVSAMLDRKVVNYIKQNRLYQKKQDK